MAVHTGHRQRMKERFLRDTFDSFADHEMLETLLYFSIPMRDTNPTAHALLAKGGTLYAVCHMAEGKMAEVPYCTHRTALLLRLLCECGRRVLAGAEEEKPVYNTRAALKALALELASDGEETVAVLFDNQYHPMKVFTAWRGYYASGAFRASLIAEPALLARASQVMLVSTHTNRIPRPDPYERATTRYLADSLSFVGLHLVEHFIVSGSLTKGVMEDTLGQGGAAELRENDALTGEEGDCD